MEVYRYIRKERVNKNGYCAIRMRAHLNGKPVELTTGERCRPEHWDKEAQKMDSKAPYAHVINGKLNLWEEILFNVFHEYKRKNDPLNPDLLKAELQARLPKQDEPEPAPVAPDVEEAGQEQTEFFRLFYQWRDSLLKKRQKGTGRKTSPNTIKGVNSSIKRFQEFENHWGKPIALATCDKKFYQEFENYMLDTLDQGINTFGKHVSKLKSFLRWCEEELELDVNKKYRRFEAPSIYVGVDALSARELESIYNFNFKSEEIRKQVHAGYSGKTAPDLNHELIDRYLQDLEIARDVFLMCCYTGMRISDIIKLDYGYFKDEHIEIPATKTLNTCYIPLYDDSLFKPGEILARYEGLYATCLPPSPLINEHLKTIARLVKIKRLNLSTKIGRKTFVTLKLYQGVPTRMVMQATGHKTESSFNRYAGIDTNELISEFKRQSARMGARMGTKAGTI